MELQNKKNTLSEYPLYEDTGIKWLGKIPKNWELRRFKYIFKEINERSLKGDEELLSVSHYTGVTKKRDNVEEGDLLTNASSLEGYKKVVKGDLVSNIMLAWNGSLGFSPFDGITSPAYSVYRLYDGNHDKYFHYLLRTEIYKAEFKRNSSGVIDSRLRLYTDDFFKINSILPPLSEQIIIAQFLDRKTALIDQAISIKEKQIELLKERRQILIHKAVTRGLNPNVKMKDSGVEWIGEAPEHWRIMELKRLVDPKRKITYGIVQPGELDPTGRFMIRGQDYSKGWAYPDTFFRVSDRIELPYKRSRVVTGDILITIVGAGCGNLEIIPDWLDGANLTQTTARIAIDQSKYWSKYFYYLLYSNVGISQMKIYLKGAAQPGLNLEHIKIYRLPIPTKNEQIEIANYIEKFDSFYENTLSKKKKEIEKLKEYKATLINSVVTGKIKVS